MKPHKDQDGYKYIRVKTYGRDKIGNEVIIPGTLIYNDNKESWTRIISSVRVERAVETDDYLRRCEDEGLDVAYGSHVGSPGKGWLVYRYDLPENGHGPTLCEAYGDYRAARAKREREQ